MDAIGWPRERMDALGRSLQRLLVVADGAYCASKLFKKLPEGVVLLARCAKNRALYESPLPEKSSRRPQGWLSEGGGWREAGVMESEVLAGVQARRQRGSSPRASPKRWPASGAGGSGRRPGRAGEGPLPKRGWPSASGPSF
ncbi:MAG: hypothetical protein ACRDSJ_06675 [Rubrobacteraceae bacterium]